MKRTASYTWETEAGLPAGWSMSVDLDIDYECEPGEAASWDNPATADTASLVNAVVRRVEFFDIAGETVDGSAIGIDHAAIEELFYSHVDREELQRYLLEQVYEAARDAEAFDAYQRELSYRERSL